MRNSDLCAAGVDFHGVNDWPTYNSDAKNIPAERTPETLPSCSFTAARSISRKPLISPRVWRGKGVEIEQLIFPGEIHGFLLSRNWPAAYQAMGDFVDRRSKVLEK